MTIKKEILDSHVIYGEWDDVLNNQFLVYYYPNGMHCIVFIMGGIDYGGGISYWFNSLSERIDNIIKNNKDESDREIKELIENLPEAVLARKR